MWFSLLATVEGLPAGLLLDELAGQEEPVNRGSSGHEVVIALSLPPSNPNFGAQDLYLLSFGVRVTLKTTVVCDNSPVVGRKRTTDCASFSAGKCS